MNNRLKISNQQRIVRILQRICQSELPVLVRVSPTSGTVVKANAIEVGLDKEKPDLRLGHVSVGGMRYLQESERVQVEFVMMATKVVFVSNVVSRDKNSVVVELPKSLVSIERRKNVRYTTTPDWCCFLDLSVWEPDVEDNICPPAYPHQIDMSSYLPVVDISQTGLCIVSRFPDIMGKVTRGITDAGAHLILPMQTPVEMAVEIRWSKRIRERSVSPKGESQAVRSYRLGVQFVSPTEDAQLFIRQYIQRLSQLNAI